MDYQSQNIKTLIAAIRADAAGNLQATMTDMDLAANILERYADQIEREEKRHEDLKNAEQQARAQVASIVEMVAALNCDYDRLEELRDMCKEARLIMWNMAGYMPDMEPFITADSEDGREALASEMEDRAYYIEQGADLQGPDDNGRDDSDEPRADVAEMQELRETAEKLRNSDCEEFSRTIGAYHYSMGPADRPADDSDAEELTELEAAAGDYESQDAAREAINSDPLEIQVRSDWYAPGEESEPGEYKILLCTGGPAVRIVGDLDQYKQPSSARIEYQDWFTPWTELVDIESAEQEALLTYAQQFYFGE